MRGPGKGDNLPCTGGDTTSGRPRGRTRLVTMVPAMSDAAVDARWVAGHLRDPAVRVVEVDVSRAAYDQGHIPGAVLWNAYSDLRDAGYQPVPRPQFEDLVARSGIERSDRRRVRIRGRAGILASEANGYDDVRMLDGSRDQWAQTGEPWATDVPSPPITARGLPPAVSALIATREAVERAIEDPTRILLDVRSDLEYTGERFWPSGASEGAGRPGHVPGATSVPIDLLRTENGA